MAIHVCKNDGNCLHLKDRDRQIIHAVARGMSNKEIARSMGRALPTIKNRLSEIYLFTGVQDRTQLAIYAWRNKLIRD